MSNKGLFPSSLSKKYAMAATGLFLCLFLVGHLLGNLQLFQGGQEGKDAFNAYALFMTTFPLVKILSYATYLGILLHVVDGFMLVLANRAARPVRYAKEKGSANSGWSSRNMAILGTIVLAFLATHMQNFWYVMHFGNPKEYVLESGVVVKDLHEVVLAFFGPANSLAGLAVAFYVLAQLAIGFHLWHGFASAFQSFGLRSAKYTPIIARIGQAFSVLVPLAFAAIPVYLYFTQL
jgi:succinate dehydrogenase / fumarate reductase cytochrome b subunit